jgi:hypothetical protein
LTFGLGAFALLLAVATARWSAQARHVEAANERLEREIAQASRERDAHRAAVERLRQPLAIRTRVMDLHRNGGRPRPENPRSKPEGRAAARAGDIVKGAQLEAAKSAAKRAGAKPAARPAAPSVKSAQRLARAGA